MSKRNVLFVGTGLFLLAILSSQVPVVRSRIAWRYEVAKTYAKNVINPIGDVPRAVPNLTSTKPSASQTAVPSATQGVIETAMPSTATPAPIPAQALLGSPPYEKQTPNNCGPAALSMMLHMFGWSGSQKDISDVIKPVNGDRNVNPEEMAYWVRNYAGWLRIEYRVGGELVVLKRLLAAGYPVIIEGTTSLNPDDSGWPDDDLWGAQDTYRGPDRKIPFNLGSNLVYFERYDEANAAYDRARELGLPQRTLRYQFGPFIANFQTNRTDDLLALTEYALQRTEMSEEAWLWHGWALYRHGDITSAIADWRQALSVRPGYEDALYALNFVGATP